jgi:uncharacterized repeat protein (TIGR04052 family)
MTRNHLRLLLSLTVPVAAPMLFLVACAEEAESEPTPAERTVEIAFAAMVGDQPAACGTTYTDVGASGAEMELQDLRFYVSELTLITADDQLVEVELEASDWQSQGVALLDFEDGTSACSANGNAQMNDHVHGTVPDLDYVGLRFTLGIPEALNHQDVATADAPFDTGSMFWVWQSGYKFVRIDMRNNAEAPDNNWFVHLGSGGCVSAAPVDAPETACARPNRPTYTFAAFDPDSDTVVLDIAGLLEGVDILVDTPDTPFGCMSNPGEPDDCTRLFRNLGLDFATGGAADCGFDECQNAFSIQ